MFSNSIKTFALSVAILALYAPLNESEAGFNIICEYRCELEFETNLGVCTLGSGICRLSVEAVSAANALACTGSAAAVAFCLSGVATRRIMGINDCQAEEGRCAQAAGSRYTTCKIICGLLPGGGNPR